MVAKRREEANCPDQMLKARALAAGVIVSEKGCEYVRPVSSTGKDF